VRHPISPRVHGVLDYSTSAAVAAAPLLFDFPTPARWLFESLAAGYTGLSSVTNYPLSAKRLVPFKAHGAAEAAAKRRIFVVPAEALYREGEDPSLRSGCQPSCARDDNLG
jgi:hypothetical protein